MNSMAMPSLVPRTTRPRARTSWGELEPGEDDTFSVVPGLALSAVLMDKPPAERSVAYSTSVGAWVVVWRRIFTVTGTRGWRRRSVVEGMGPECNRVNGPTRWSAERPGGA